MEKCEPLPEGLRFVLALDAKPQPRMKRAEAGLEPLHLDREGEGSSRCRIHRTVAPAPELQPIAFASIIAVRLAFELIRIMDWPAV
jgi:hypothetical protein